MTNKFILASITLAALTICGCQHNLEHNMVPDKLGFSYTSQLQQPSVFNDGMEVAVIKSGKGNSSATLRIERLTEDELKKWCMNNGAYTETINEETKEKTITLSYELAPEIKYEVSEEELSFAASDIRKTFTVNWNTTFFANSSKNNNEYVIGFKLVDSSIELGENRDTLIIHPALSHISFKDKDLKTVFPTSKDSETINEYEAEVNLDKAVPSEDVIVELSVDNSYIEQESLIKNKEYKEAPQGLFSFVNNTVTIKAGETVSHFNYKIDLTVLYNEEGKFKEENVNYMIPIVFSKKTPELLGSGKAPIGYVVVMVLDDDVVIPPDGPTSLIHGPWEILEGKDMHIGADPLCTNPNWFGNYNPTKLVDWTFGFGNDNDASKNGYWGSYFWTPAPFPMVFVFDTGATYTFNRFYKVDADTFQGQFRDFEVYVANEYVGTDTNWKLACKGKTDFKGWKDYKLTKNSDGTQDIDKVLEMFSYPIPADIEAEGSEFNYTRGRYIKLVITASSKVSSKDCGYIMEFYADGWSM